jgi:hypothetical protein
MIDQTAPVLVVHVQRTGGTSLRAMLENTCEKGSVFPSCNVLGAREGGRYVTPAEILRTWDEIPPHRFLFGHVLAVFAECLPVPYKSATVLREPVNRSISITQLHSRNTGRPVSDLIRDEEFLQSHILDMQTRIFGSDVEAATLRPQESPLSTDMSLERAMSRLEGFSFIGTTETFGESLHRFDRTFHTAIAHDPIRENLSVEGDVPHTELEEFFSPLVKRDVALYQWIVDRQRPS